MKEEPMEQIRLEFVLRSLDKQIDSLQELRGQIVSFAQSYNKKTELKKKTLSTNDLYHQ